MKKLSYTNFNRGVMVVDEIKGAVFVIDWDRKIWALYSESITFPTGKRQKELLKEFKPDLSGLTTHKFKNG